MIGHIGHIGIVIKNNTNVAVQNVLKTSCNWHITILDHDHDDLNIPIHKIHMWHFNMRWFNCFAKRSLVVPNAGGNSQISEAISINLMCKFFPGCSVILETSIRTVWARWPIVDYVIVRSGRTNVGISVVRAMHYLDEFFFDQDEAIRIMYKKLNGLVVAQRGCYQYSWSILHVICQSNRIAKICKSVAHQVASDLDIADSIEMMFSIVEHQDVYKENPVMRNLFVANGKTSSYF